MASGTITNNDEGNRMLLGNSIPNLMSYTSSTNYFTAPKDGYIVLSSWGSNSITARILNTSGNSITATCPAGTTMTPIFCCKGSRIFVEYTSATSLSANYHQYAKY